MKERNKETTQHQPNPKPSPPKKTQIHEPNPTFLSLPLSWSELEDPVEQVDVGSPTLWRLEEVFPAADEL